MVHRRLSPAYADDAAEFGRQVRARRYELDLSQDQLVARMGHSINKKTLARIERGYGDDEQKSPINPELRVLIELCKALGGRMVIDLQHSPGFVIEFTDESVHREP